MKIKKNYFEDEPLWYKEAIIYETHVKSFYDSNGDGIGDFNGLTEKLGYLKNLGITAIWILPFYPSPLKDDGYDISDYFSIHPNYGTLRDFKEFLKKAHEEGIKVITELVLNHTSDQHSWFQKSRHAKSNSALRNFYVWSNTPEKYKDARIIFKDFETSNWTFDPVANAYYWHRFYSHQPDLNYDSEYVQKAILGVIDYWMELGVDGMRLDAVPYLYEQDDTNCENLPKTYEFLRKVRSYIDSKYKNRLLLAEANQWPEDASAYFGKGDICHMAFHFPLMPRMFMAMWMEDSFPIYDIFEQTPNIPDICQWALFLRNHDELTLEMVTDEERDYMYRVYAKDPNSRINLGIRRRLAPLLGNNRRKIELMNILLFSLPGTPIIYYGDEIGMGDNFYLGDRNGVRTPMQWSSDKNAGFSKANPQKLYLPIIIDPEYHYESVNVENGEINQSSLLWWIKRVVSMRKKFKSFGKGTLEFLPSNNSKVLAFIRQYQNENILVVINLSRFSQAVELDMVKYSDYTPYEIFSRNKFPAIKNTPYVLTLGFYDYFWFILKKNEEVIKISESEIPELTVHNNWKRVLFEKSKLRLEQDILPYYMEKCKWFKGKNRMIRNLRISESIPIDKSSFSSQFVFLDILFTEGLSETYLLFLCYASGEESEKITKEKTESIIAILKGDNINGILYEGSYNEELPKIIVSAILRKSIFEGTYGKTISLHGKYLKKIFKEKKIMFTEKTQLTRLERNNTSYVLGNDLFLKFYRKLDEGPNPEVELSKYLSEKTNFSNTPSFAGSFKYLKSDSKITTIGILQKYIPNQGDAWKYTIDSLGRYYERLLAKKTEIVKIPELSSSFLTTAEQEIPLLVQELIGGDYLERIKLLGKRTAELHMALYSSKNDLNFSPEPFSLLYQRSLYQSMQGLTKKVFDTLIRKQPFQQESTQNEINEVLNFKKDIILKFKLLLNKKISSMKIRIHGNYNLANILYTGNDFFIIDFEGDSKKSLSERRLKRSPIRDLSTMITSFQYASYISLTKNLPYKVDDLKGIEPWAIIWYTYTGSIFLKSYLDTVKDMPFIPQAKEEFETLLSIYLLEKSIYDLDYELNNRPTLFFIPSSSIKYSFKK